MFLGNRNRLLHDGEIASLQGKPIVVASFVNFINILINVLSYFKLHVDSLEFLKFKYRHCFSSPLSEIFWHIFEHTALGFDTAGKFTTHRCDLYAEVGWSSLYMQRSIHWLTFIYKAILRLSPSSLWVFMALVCWHQYCLRSKESSFLCLNWDLNWNG